MRRLDDAQAQHLLNRYALIGGFAVSVWGIPRATHDVDFAVALGGGDPAALSRHLGGEFHSGGPDDPLRGIFETSVVVEGTPIPVQAIILPTAWDEVIFDGAERLPITGCTVPVVSWQSLILLKLYAGGPQDLLDAQQILSVRRPTQAEKQSVSALAEKVGLLAAWESLFAS